MASFANDEAAIDFAQKVADRTGLNQVVELRDDARWAVRPLGKGEHADITVRPVVGKKRPAQSPPERMTVTPEVEDPVEEDLAA